MRSRRPELDRDAALSRRLAQLGDELSAHRGGLRPARPEPSTTDLTTTPWWDGHTRPAAPRHPAPPAARPVALRPPPPVPPPGPPVRRPAPGRHAATRAHAAGLVALGPAQLAVVAVV